MAILAVTEPSIRCRNRRAVTVGLSNETGETERFRLDWLEPAVSKNQPRLSLSMFSTRRATSAGATVSRSLSRVTWMSPLDRKSVVWGKSVSVRLNLGGCRIIKKKKQKNSYHNTKYN